MKTKLSISTWTGHATGGLLWVLLLAVSSAHALDTCAETGDSLGRSVARGDFNGDGYQDLAIGLKEKIGSLNQAGAVEVIYGAANGLDSPNRQFWNQDIAGVQDAAESPDEFGYSLAAGDFNGDGFDDLAIGVLWEGIGDTGYANGAVSVLYGSSSGLSAITPDDQFWYQGSAGVEGEPEFGDSFGHSLAAGDFNGDGFDDLAIGVTEDIVVERDDAGAVHVLYGSPTGLSATAPADQFWHQNSSGVRDAAEPGDSFGYALAAGDFNGDGFDDLAIGVNGESLDGAAEGAVSVLYGSSAGLSAITPDDQFWHQNSSGVRDTAETGDSFGSSLTSGDFNGDGFDDLAIGVTGEDVGYFEDAGAVNVLYGSPTGLGAVAPDDQLWHQNRSGVRNTVESRDLYGYSLASGDFNSDGFDDLAVGVPGEDIGDVQSGGAVNVLYGSSTGLSATAPDDQFWHQNSSNIMDASEFGDSFGYSLTAGDFSGDGRDDLAIGVPYEQLVDLSGNILYGAGAVNVLYGSDIGLSAKGNQFWTQELVCRRDRAPEAAARPAAEAAPAARAQFACDACAESSYILPPQP